MQIHEWIADQILANVSEENHADFLDALQNQPKNNSHIL